MDKLKEQLAPIQKYSFWILCGVILVVCLGSWWRATGNIKTEHGRLMGEIDSKKKAVNAILSNHPNDNTNKGMDDVTQREGEDVAKAWGKLVSDQEKVLVWPVSVFGPEFVAEVTPLRPPELKVTGAFGTEIRDDFLRLARNEYQRVLPDLAKIIGAKWKGTVSGGAGGMGGMLGGGPGGGDAPGGIGAAMAGGLLPGGGGQQQTEEDDSIVVWNSGNQSELMSIHFEFIASDTAKPSTLQVLYAQEDYWVLQNIMNIIKATNERFGAISKRHEAAIKYIDYVRLGRSALAGGGRVSASNSGGMGAPGSGADDLPGAGMMPGMPGMGGMGGADGGPGGGAMPGGPGEGGAGAGMPGGIASGMGGMPGMPGAGGSGAPASPTDGRYVDPNYKALASKRLIAAMKGSPEKAEDMLLAVAKRVPVRMSFKMDQRRLPALLAECGNSRLPVEVKQVRINRQGSTSGFGGGDGGPGGGPGAGGPGMMPGMMGGMMAGGGPGDEPGGGAGLGAFGGAGGVNANRSQVADSTIDPYEISVEIYGIVYIYNPVNRMVLGLKEPQAPTAPANVSPVTTPTSTTPPAAPATPAVNTGASTTGPAAELPSVN